MSPPLVLLLLIARAASTEWDLAVLTSNSLELLGQEMSHVSTTMLGIKNISALTYDPLYLSHYFAANGHPNASIFRVQASRDGRVTSVEPLVKKQPGRIYSLAYDPESTSIFWTSYKQILRSQVELSLSEGEVVHQFEKDRPLAIVVEPCSRYIYWSYRMRYIDRSRMDGTQRERIVEGLYMPIALTISQAERKLYWVDEGPGMSFRVGRSLLDGSKKETILESNHQQPNSLAVRPMGTQNGGGGTIVLWTDKMSNQLWALRENSSEPEALRTFDAPVFSLAIADSMEHLDAHVCSNIITMRDQVPYAAIVPTASACIHGTFSMSSGSCVCTPGYIGSLCETSICFNFCLNGGTCSLREGEARCRCPPGRSGSRCELDPCSGYCSNGGTCREGDGPGHLSCDCPSGWLGPRCNLSTGYCSFACANGLSDRQFCGCNSTLFLAVDAAASTAALQPGSPNYKSWFFLSLVGCGTLSLLVLLLALHSCRLGRRRPLRIKRQYLVTPRGGGAAAGGSTGSSKGGVPQQARTSPDCEIPIENCCNMNICDTPCYEPELRAASGRNKKEEKRGLLREMEVQPDCGKTF